MAGFLGSGSECGFGVYVLGIPVVQGPKAKKCKDKTDNERNQINEEGKTDRKEIEEESDVWKTYLRNQQQMYSSAYRNLDGSNPSEAWAASLGSALPAVMEGVMGAVNPASLLFGGSSGTSQSAAPVIDTTTLLLGGLAIGAVALAVSAGRK